MALVLVGQQVKLWIIYNPCEYWLLVFLIRKFFVSGGAIGYRAAVVTLSRIACLGDLLYRDAEASAECKVKANAIFA